MSPVATWVFSQAQAYLYSPPAPYAWGASPTESSNAMPPPPGTACTRPSPSMSRANCSFAMTISPYALTYSTGVGAPASVMTSATFALDVVKVVIELKPVIELRQLRALIPYKPDAWEHLLNQAGLLHQYCHIPNSLQFGFTIKSPSISSTQTPPNCPSIIEFHPQFSEIMHDEFAKGWYFGPLSKANLESHISPFQSSPFSIIPKPAKIGKFCIL